MPQLYRVIVLGNESSSSTGAIRDAIALEIREFGMTLGNEVVFLSGSVAGPEAIATVGLFFGSEPIPAFAHSWMLSQGIPIIPIVSDLARCSAELPNELSHLNAMKFSPETVSAIAVATLECLGLLHKQRRVFLSYVRKETRAAALQIHDSLCARQFDVFLDTHDVRPGQHFQDALWHRLCDSDVMVMLDSPNYFERRWTREEFGKANLKKAAILRVAWPGVSRSASLGITDNLEILASDLDGGALSTSALNRIGDQIESLRSRGIAVRNANLIGILRTAVGEINGRVVAIGACRRVEIKLPRGKTIFAYPTLGVPSAETLNDVESHAGESPAAIIYDHIGILDRWLLHLKWLGQRIPTVRWIQASRVGWDLAAWDSE